MTRRMPVIVSAALIVAVYAVAVAMVWREQSRPKFELCPLCNQEVRP